MLKKLLAALMCITMATSFVACGDEEKKEEKDSSSEIVTEAEEETEDPEKAAQEIEEAEKAVADLEQEAMENQLEVGANAPAENNDTLGLLDILPTGEWASDTIAVPGMEIAEMTIEEYAAMGGVDPSTMEMKISFTADGSLTLSSSTGTDTGTYVVDAETVYMTDSTGAGVTFTYDEATGKLALDMLGDGSMIMTFAVGQ